MAHSEVCYGFAVDSGPESSIALRSGGIKVSAKQQAPNERHSTVENIDISRALGQYHNMVTVSTGVVGYGDTEQVEKDYDTSSELAISTLVNLGYEGDDQPDDFGTAISEDLQTLLTLAAFRSKKFRSLLEWYEANSDDVQLGDPEAAETPL